MADVKNTVEAKQDDGSKVLLIPADVVSKLDRIYKARNASDFAITGKETPVTDSFILEMLETRVDADIKQRSKLRQQKLMTKLGELQAKGISYSKACEMLGLVVPKDATVQPVQIAQHK